MGNIIDNRKKWDKLSKALDNNKNRSVYVGVQAESGLHKEGQVSVATIAFANEFGTHVIPERSFIRSSFDKNKKSYQEFMNKISQKIVEESFSLTKGLNLLGLKVVSDVKDKITTLKTPPNAPSTIKSKKSSNPLIDTGQLRASITHVVK